MRSEIGSYVLHLYCKNGWAVSDGEKTSCVKDDPKSPHYDPNGWEEIAGLETIGQCRREARRRGWKRHRGGNWTYPECVKEGKA